MVVVKNISNRPVKIIELNKTIPVSNNNYVLPEKIYEKYKYQLSMINVMIDSEQANNLFETNNKEFEQFKIIVEDGIKYTIAPLADFFD